MPGRTGPISNYDLGRLLGVTHAQISRMRQGSRHPSIATMGKIEQLLGWPCGEQAELVRADTTGRERGTRYAQELEVWIQNYAPDGGAEERRAFAMMNLVSFGREANRRRKHGGLGDGVKLIASGPGIRNERPAILEFPVVTLVASGERLDPDGPHITVVDLAGGQQMSLRLADAGDLADQLKRAVDDVLPRLREE